MRAEDLREQGVKKGGKVKLVKGFGTTGGTRGKMREEERGLELRF